MTPFEQVKEFHEIFGHQVDGPFDIDVALKRCDWIDEEIIEFLDALVVNDLVEQVDAIGDILYFVEGSCVAFGFGDLIVLRYDDMTIGELAFRMSGLATLLRDASNYKDLSSVVIALSAIKGICYTLAERLGVDLDEVVTAIHESNLSKLGEDGKPVYKVPGDPTSKVAKGPNFVTPTKKIKELLDARS